MTAPAPDPLIGVKLGCAVLAMAAGALILVAVLMTPWSGDDDDVRNFDEAVEDGASCSELYEIREAWPPQYVEIPEWNRTLREIGCTSPTATRTD